MQTAGKHFQDKTNLPEGVKFEIQYQVDQISVSRSELSEARKRKLEDVERLCENEDSVKSIKKLKRQNEVLSLDCEWSNCDLTTTEYAKFIKHVKEHIKDAVIRTYSPPHPDVFACLWQDCGYETPVSCDMVRHINYHSVHTKLKSQGLNMIKSQNLKGCVLDINQRNIFNDLTEPLKCLWSYCGESESEFEHPQDFFWHVSTHMHEDILDCKWADCTKRDMASKTRLKEHLRSHSQEKLIGCPTCGALFASRVKLLDHLKRQQEDISEFICTNCNKSFALERLLRDHMRSHINQYECRECGMRWPTPSSLQVHIKYRHTEDRDFPCELCDHRAKSHADLKQHTRTHQKEVLTCMEGCGFVCKSNSIMKNHFLKEHMKEGPTYACHLCDKLYRRGAYLTNHLKKMHQVFSTTSRLRYSRDETTGFYRAQLIRLEMQLEDKEDDPDDDLETLDTASSIRSATPSLNNPASIDRGSPLTNDFEDCRSITPGMQKNWHHSDSPMTSTRVHTSSPIMYSTTEYRVENGTVIFNPQDYEIIGGEAENDIEIDITGEQFCSQKDIFDATGASVIQSENLAAEIQERSLELAFGNINETEDGKVSGIKRIGAQPSDLNLFMSAIETMYPDHMN